MDNTENSSVSEVQTSSGVYLSSSRLCPLDQLEGNPNVGSTSSENKLETGDSNQLEANLKCILHKRHQCYLCNDEEFKKKIKALKNKKKELEKKLADKKEQTKQLYQILKSVQRYERKYHLSNNRRVPVMRMIYK